MWMSGTLVAASSAFTGSVLTPFFMRSGMSEAQISIYLSILQVINMVFPILVAGIAAECRNSKKYAGIWYIINALITMTFAIFCAVTVDIKIFFPMMILIGGSAAMATAIQNVYHYKVPCEVIDLKYYTVYSARSGIFNGIIGILIGFILPIMYQKLPYMLVTGIAFAAAGILTVLAAIGVFALKPLDDEVQEETKTKEKLPFHPLKDFIKLLHNHDFRYLVIPNLARGFGAGIMPLITVIALRESILTEENAAMLTSAAQIGTLLSCLVYTFLVQKLGLAITSLIGGAMMCLLPITVFGGTVWFLVVYSIVYIGFYIISMVIPNMMYRAVDQSMISIYNTWRLTLNTIGTIFSTMLFGFLIEYISAFWLLTLGTAGFIVCSLGHYLCYRKKI